MRRDLTGGGGANASVPGLFNTEMARPGAVVLNAPFLNTYVGVSDDLTLGTDLLYAVPWLVLRPAALLIGRYRVHSTTNTRTTVDTMVGGFYLGGGNGNKVHANNHVMAFGTNTLYVVSPSHHITASALAGTFGFRYVDERKPQLVELGLSGVLAGLTYTYNPTQWLAFSVMALPLSYLTGEIGEVGAIAQLNAAEVGLKKFPWRAHASLRASRWLFELGAMGISDSLVPWLNVALELGGP